MDVRDLERARPLLVTTARAVLHDEHLAQDVAQDVMLAHWRDPSRFDPERGTLTTYLRLRARSRAIDVLRSNQAAGRLVTRLGEATRGAAAEDASHAAERRHDGRLVRAATRALPPAQREAVVLTYWGGLSRTELAGAMAAPVGTTKSRLRLALARLRSDLTAEPA